MISNSWPCPNLKEFGFVLSAPHHKFQARMNEQCSILGGVDSMIQNLRENCPNLETLNITAYPRQTYFKTIILGKYGQLGLLDSLSKWLLSDPDTIYDTNFYYGEKKPLKIPRLKRVNLKFSIPVDGRKDINRYLGPQIRQKIDSMENVEIEVIPNQDEDKHECTHGFCWAIKYPFESNEHQDY